MKIKQHLFFLFFFLSLSSFFSACKHKKEIQKTIPKIKPREVVDYLNENSLKFNELSAKLKVKSELNSNKRSFNSNVRWMSNEKLWLSFSIFGIEGYRLLIDSSKFKMLDRLNRKYYDKDIEYLSQLAHMSISFEDLERILTGELLYMNGKNTSVKKNKEGFEIILKDLQYSGKALVDRKTGFLMSMELNDNFNQRKISIQYNDYETLNEKDFAMKRNIEVSDSKNNLSLDIKFTKIKLAENLEYPFEVSSKYDKVN